MTILALLNGIGIHPSKLITLNVGAYDRTKGLLRNDAPKTGRERLIATRDGTAPAQTVPAILPEPTRIGRRDG